MNEKEIARKIVEGIEADMLDRCGLSNSLEEIDEDIMQDIREGWYQIALDVISAG